MTANIINRHKHEEIIYHKAEIFTLHRVLMRHVWTWPFALFQMQLYLTEDRWNNSDSKSNFHIWPTPFCKKDYYINKQISKPQNWPTKYKTGLISRTVAHVALKSVTVGVGSRSADGRLFHSFGAQAAKLRGPKLDVRQASTWKSPSAAERKWRRLVLAVPGTHSSWRYCGAVWWRHLKMIVQSLKTILSRTGNQRRSSRSVGVMRWNFRFRFMSCARVQNWLQCLCGSGVYLIQHAIAVV